MIKLNKMVKFLLVLVTCIVVLSYIYNKFIVVKSISNSDKVIIGIIDGRLSKNYDNVLTNISNRVNSSIKTHGDELIVFANKYYTDLNIYYYDASNVNGVVDTKGIISGLEWMKQKGIRHINISMSSNKFSNKLQNYIENNQDELKVFASYHNLEQTLDYPAMYDNVIASGKKSRIIFKNNDIEYRSNNIVLISKDIKRYSGNSFLSIITMIHDIIS